MREFHSADKSSYVDRKDGKWVVCFRGIEEKNLLQKRENARTIIRMLKKKHGGGDKC